MSQISAITARFTTLSSKMLSSFSLVLPGQSVGLPQRAPAPQKGTGVYERDGQLRASLFGTPRLEGTVRFLAYSPTSRVITRKFM